MLKVHRFMLLFLMPFFVQQASAQEQEKVPVHVKPVSGNVFEILGGRGSNGGAFVGENGILVIDAKMDQESVAQTMSGLSKISDKSIIYLVNTHSDGDHVNGNRYFPESVTIIAHENCRKDFFLPKRDGSPSDWLDPELIPFTPGLTFSEKMNIHMGPDKVELWYFGTGHTSGDLVVYFPGEKIAFLGDQLFLERPQLIHSHKGGNSFEHVATLTRMLETIDAEKFCSGHSEICDRETIRKHISDIRKTQQKVIQLVKENKNLDEVISSFKENEARLVTSIYNEVKESKD